MALAESLDLVGLLDGSTIQPSIYLTPTTPIENRTNNPAYLEWRKRDRLLRGWIIVRLSPEALGLIIGLETSKNVWDALKNAYAQSSQKREFTLRQLTYL